MPGLGIPKLLQEQQVRMLPGRFSLVDLEQHAQHRPTPMPGKAFCVSFTHSLEQNRGRLVEHRFGVITSGGKVVITHKAEETHVPANRLESKPGYTGNRLATPETHASWDAFVQTMLNYENRPHEFSGLAVES